MKLADITIAMKKLRLRKAPLRFRPALKYVVEVGGVGYVHPSRVGITGGETAWADSSLWFSCHKDAADYARTRAPYEKARVVKLNVCAFEEPVNASKAATGIPHRA